MVTSHILVLWTFFIIVCAVYLGHGVSKQKILHEQWKDTSQLLGVSHDESESEQAS